jgi:glycosyltransferase involved in cell wall biosynthesis
MPERARYPLRGGSRMMRLARSTAPASTPSGDMRILIVSYLAPPHNAIGAVRVGKTAKYLRRFGHDVRILTARDLPLAPTLDVELPADHVVATKWADVHVPFLLAIRGVQRVLRWIPRRRRNAGDGAPSSNAGNGASASRGGGPGAAAALPDFRRRGGLRWFAYAQYTGLVHVPDAAAGWYPYAVRAGGRIVKDWRPDVILASGGPWSSLVVAARLARRLRFPGVAELRDLWSENTMWITAECRRGVDRVIERKVLGTAGALVTVSEPLAEALRRTYRAPVTVVLNGYDAEHTPDAPPGGTPGVPLRIVYTGNLFPGRDLSPLLRALLLLGDDMRDVRVEIVGNRDTSLQAHYERIAAEIGLGEALRWLPAVPHREAMQVQRSADVLLLLTANDPAERGVYTGKIFEYVGARRPILLIGLQDGVAADLVRENALGAAVLTPDDIALQLRTWLETKRRGAGLPDVSAATSEQFTREAQTRVVERVLDDVVRASGAGRSR